MFFSPRDLGTENGSHLFEEIRALKGLGDELKIADGRVLVIARHEQHPVIALIAKRASRGDARVGGDELGVDPVRPKIDLLDRGKQSVGDLLRAGGDAGLHQIEVA